MNEFAEPCFCVLQLVSSMVIIGGTNVAGALTHHPRELAQRQAFLETRQCMDARLTTQRENQQQVSAHDPENLASVSCPSCSAAA